MKSALAIDLTTIAPEVRVALEGLQTEVQRLRTLLHFKDEEIRLLNIKKFGPKGDKLSSDQSQLLLGEVIVSAQEVEQEAARPEKEKQVPPPVKTPRATHPGRDPLPEHLERREVIIPCHPEDCHCSKCGTELPIIGYEVREELGCRPAEFFVRVIKREKRGSHCLPEQGVAVAPAPTQIIPKSKLSDEFIIEVLAAKFQQHLPVYRQCAVLLENHGITISRQTLNDAVLGAADLLSAVVRAQAQELVAGPYLQADETRMPCQTGEKTGKNHNAFIWEFSQPGKAVVFEFKMGRGRDGPKEFLKGFKGKLQCDGYEVYNLLGEGIVYVACMAHIRRKFVDASKLAPLDPIPIQIVAEFSKLYQVEMEARDKGMKPEERLALRKERSEPVMNALKTRLVALQQSLNPGGALAKACDYALNQWSRMEEYLKDGIVEIDNNWCEGAMRPIALGRKNWLHVGSEFAGPKVAAIMSIVETCRRLGINLRSYLSDVLPKLSTCSITEVATLTPTAWKNARSPAPVST